MQRLLLTISSTTAFKSTSSATVFHNWSDCTTIPEAQTHLSRQSVPPTSCGHWPIRLAATARNSVLHPDLWDPDADYYHYYYRSLDRNCCNWIRDRSAASA